MSLRPRAKQQLAAASTGINAYNEDANLDIEGGGGGIEDGMNRKTTMHAIASSNSLSSNSVDSSYSATAKSVYSSSSSLSDSHKLGFSMDSFIGQMLHPHRASKIQNVAQWVTVGLLLLSFVSMLVLESTLGAILCLIYAACAFGVVVSLILSQVVLSMDDGTAEMKKVSDPILYGASGFLNVQYNAIMKFALPLAFLIFVSYQFRPENNSNSTNGSGAGKLSNGLLGFIVALGFTFGALCSAFSGYLAMWVAARSNVRVTSAARKSGYHRALVACFQGGAFSAVLNLTLCIGGVVTFYILLLVCLVSDDEASLVRTSDLPMLCVGFGFGASFVALFMQLGGGIYTKAADVGADLVGKVEQGIPEDDPRNPAVIADLVGDMVGDCVGSSADVFESVAAEIVGAMILGSTLTSSNDGTMSTVGLRFTLFPLVVHAMDILVSSAGIYAVSTSPIGTTTTPTTNNNHPIDDPMQALQHGYRVALGLSIVGFYFICHLLLHTDCISDENNDDFLFTSHNAYFLCGLVGMICAFIIVKSTQYYTDYAYAPVQSIARASTTGHGTNIIIGISVGLKSVLIPTLTVSIAVLTAYYLGSSSSAALCLSSAEGGQAHNAGLFGTAVATMGMLSNAVYILSMNNYGPIADNAGGIAEMSMQPTEVRDVTDKLDAAGNVTKAITKGYSIGSASMACFLLFGAFMDEFSAYSGLEFRSVNLATPEVLIGGLLGSMIIFYFVGLAIAAVGSTAHEVVMEVRRQFQERPGILTFNEKPDHARCVSLVTEAALHGMQLPGLICVLTPIVIGILFRIIGEYTNRPLLGAEVLASYLMFSTTTGILMALFLDTTGGAWDNAKKYIELGNFGGKNSEPHKAAVTGDTVGDPFKDTAGPSLHVVIKLLSTTILVAGPLFVASSSTA